MWIKPVLSFRSLFIGTIVPILHSVAVFALGERVLPSMFAETFVADVATDEIAAGGDRESFNDAEPESVQKDDKDSEPLVGADGKLLFEIAYPSTNNNANSVIIAKDPTAASASAELSGNRDIDPAWSSDGSKIVFVSRRDGNLGNSSRRTNSSGSLSNSRWSFPQRPAFSSLNLHYALLDERNGAVFDTGCRGSVPAVEK